MRQFFLTIMYILLILSDVSDLVSSFRLRLKRQIRLRIKRAIAGSDVDSQRQQQDSKRDDNPYDRPDDCRNAGGVGHVHGIRGNRGRKRRRKKEDIFQIEQGVQNALHRQETNNEGGNAWTAKPRHEKQRAGQDNARKKGKWNPRQRAPRCGDDWLEKSEDRGQQKYQGG